jgi:hypothetical protein
MQQKNSSNSKLFILSVLGGLSVLCTTMPAIAVTADKGKETAPQSETKVDRMQLMGGDRLRTDPSLAPISCDEPYPPAGFPPFPDHPQLPVGSMAGSHGQASPVDSFSGPHRYKVSPNIDIPKDNQPPQKDAYSAKAVEEPDKLDADTRLDDEFPVRDGIRTNPR